MPKIRTPKIHRLHISLTDSTYKKAKLLAEKNDTSVSEIFRTCIDLLVGEASIHSQDAKVMTETPKKISNLGNGLANRTISNLDF